MIYSKKLKIGKIGNKISLEKASKVADLKIKKAMKPVCLNKKKRY